MQAPYRRVAIIGMADVSADSAGGLQLRLLGSTRDLDGAELPDPRRDGRIPKDCRPRHTGRDLLERLARLIDDPDHSEEEDRFLLLGFSIQARCLIVSHCYRQSDSVIRLISARRATAQEEEVYWSFR